MKLLNKYQSRVLQFALELTARLESGPLSAAEAETMARAACLDYAGQVTDPLVQAGLLVREDGAFRLPDSLRPPHLPLSGPEREYLAYILSLPAAPYFLDEETRALLNAGCADAPDGTLAQIRRLDPTGRPLPEQPGPEGFRRILEAIRLRRGIRYTYVTKDGAPPAEGRALPWKLEYSVYDRRWWIILYLPEEQRTVKAQLHNLSDITLGDPSPVPEEEITAAMDRLMEPEPVTLEVERTRGALERCFLVFENQLFEQTRQLSDQRYRLTFRYYRFDRSEILRRLLYLGPAVRLLGPADLRRDLIRLVDQALACNG